MAKKPVKTKKARSSSNQAKVPSPHVLANEYLKSLGKGACRLRFYGGEFYRWDGRCYTSVSKAQFKAEVTRFANEWAVTDAGKSNKTPFKVTTALVGNLIQALSSLALVPDDVDLPAWLGAGDDSEASFISFQNGLLDLKALLEGKPANLQPATANWFSTITLPYKFDSTAQCPGWKVFLAEIFESDEERIDLLQEWFGYLLTPNTSEQKFLMLEGEGSNGKGVVFDILTFALGEENVSNVALELFGERFQLIPTIGKLANVVTEVGELRSIPEALLKAFVAGDRMYSDRKGLQGIEFRPTARMVMAVNNRPRFNDKSQGIWRRMNLIPFNVTIPDERQDRNLVSDLKAELPGILNWAIEGERRRRRQGGFTKPRVCAEAVQEYRLEANPARIFLSEQVGVSPNGEVFTDDLYATYKRWCQQNGYECLSGQSFGKEIKRQFPTAKRQRESRGQRAWFYSGILLLPPEEEPLLSQAA